MSTLKGMSSNPEPSISLIQAGKLYVGSLLPQTNSMNGGLLPLLHYCWWDSQGRLDISSIWPMLYDSLLDSAKNVSHHWSPRNCCVFKTVTRMLGLTKRSRQLNFLCLESHRCCLLGWRTSCKSVLKSSWCRQRSQHRSGFSRRPPTRSKSWGFTYRWNCLCHLPSAFRLWHCNIGSGSWASITILPLEGACAVLSLEDCGSLRWRSYRCHKWDWYATCAISLSAFPVGAVGSSKRNHVALGGDPTRVPSRGSRYCWCAREKQEILAQDPRYHCKGHRTWILHCILLRDNVYRWSANQVVSTPLHQMFDDRFQSLSV